MAWKISVSLERDREALLIVQRMIYAAAKAQGVTDLKPTPWRVRCAM